MRSASKLLGAADFIDLLKIARELGEEGEKEMIRRNIREILGSGSRANE